MFINFLKKETCTKFCGVLISFNEVMKLQSFEFGVSDFISIFIYKTFHRRFSFHIFVNFIENKPLRSFVTFLTIFLET